MRIAVGLSGLVAIGSGLFLSGCQTTAHRDAVQLQTAVERAAAPTPLPELSDADRTCPENPTRPRVTTNPDGSKSYPKESTVGTYVTGIENVLAECRARHGRVVRVYDAAAAMSRAIPPAD